MTVRELYRNTLVELNKEEASALYVEDFLYYANKAVNWYVNARYGVYDTSQQLSDDLRALRKGPELLLFGDALVAKENEAYAAAMAEEEARQQATIDAIKEIDKEYADCMVACSRAFEGCVIGCSTIYQPEVCVEACSPAKVEGEKNCEEKLILKYPSLPPKERVITKVTGNLNYLAFDYRHLLNCIITVKVAAPVFECDQKKDSSMEYAAKRLTSDRKAAILNNSFLEPRFFRPYYDISGGNLVINVGEKDDKKFEVTSVTMEYLKNPEQLFLDADMLTEPFDRSEAMEFPEYVCIEILNVLVMYVLEQGTDPRLSTSPSINRSITGGGSGNDNTQ